MRKELGRSDAKAALRLKTRRYIARDEAVPKRMYCKSWLGSRDPKGNSVTNTHLTVTNTGSHAFQGNTFLPHCMLSFALFT